MELFPLQTGRVPLCTNSHKGSPSSGRRILRNFASLSLKRAISSTDAPNAGRITTSSSTAGFHTTRKIQRSMYCKNVYLEPGDVLYFGVWTLQKVRPFPFKTRAIWVPGICIYIYIYHPLESRPLNLKNPFWGGRKNRLFENTCIHHLYVYYMQS